MEQQSYGHVSMRNIYTTTVRPTMNLFTSKDVHHLINTVSSEYLYLSCYDVCDWSMDIRQQQQCYVNFRFAICQVYIFQFYV